VRDLTAGAGTSECVIGTKATWTGARRNTISRRRGTASRSEVVSRPLTSVGPNATLREDDIEAVIRGPKAQPVGEIELAGPELAVSLTNPGIIDGHRLNLHPIVLGRGKPFFSDPRRRAPCTRSNKRPTVRGHGENPPQPMSRTLAVSAASFLMCPSNLPLMPRASAGTSAAAAMVTITFAVGCATEPPESPEQAQVDAATAERVHAALEADRLHLYIGLEVQVRHGAAYISALTFDPSVRDEATEIARNVPGVAKVVNEIEVSAGSGGQ
jgi:hypothetical protein